MSVSSLLRGAAVALAVTALLVPTAAHAGKSVHRDAVGDVGSFTDESENFTTLPGQKVGDVVRSVGKHKGKRVSFSVKMRALPKTKHSHGVVTRIVTNKKTYFADAHSAPGLGSDVFLTRNGKLIDCAGMRHKRSAKRNTITLSVPRSCLGNPRWVKLGGGVYWLKGNKSFVDESHRTSIQEGKDLAVGPRIRR
ncbi:hypothetical protein [Nocardioides sp.]|uniref:hypothetical protein n=1 Tax=Nocardioides sp. TaxID=35761 RepID=UPI002736727A|nr:hypothetical protein [Nocardioides sp.]MDP3891552.1 hypothetical protein [Nocardioides sp.]